ncbi:biotin--[acetyl-CoA-carboxylase] ligase [Spongiactinospora sp. TRM90649]|uniref:biotin--[acetyl-CoA-carboxylase] ligase n=1 Tax=Spongiactinospora sp. TRM90649 TaxID=3031114 RepID=UPI0023F6317F|nr:biotin--[acetyl-CoA-carboxylase] ligase [Spongiactinospora sp. TRM90649]MDF5751233.1 biotin--[acetyl-CoA-carboxylase] ligase [Spongiactinospora sp. TRM90649]
MADSPYSDLDRPPLSQEALTRALVRPGGLWTSVTVVEETGSTNADLAAAVREGATPAADEGAVLVAELQTAGRGRLGRSWTTPPRSALMFSMVLRPGVPPPRIGWLPLLTGLATATAVRRLAETDVRLKWPNDLLIGERKLAGILAERVETAVIVGVGLNVSLHGDELPVETATSLAEEKAACLDRDPLLRAVLREFEAHYRDWVAADGDPEASGLRSAYLTASATVGTEVRVDLPGGGTLTGPATDVDENGCLIVRADGREHALSAGDVVHVRRDES